MVIIGWDWAIDKHDLVMLDDAGQVQRAWRIAHGGAALQQLVAELAARDVAPAHVHIGLEDHDGPLIGFLQAQGYQVHALNPKQVQAARTAFCNSAAKDDVRDALVMAQMLARELAHWRVAAPPDGPADELRQYCVQHEALTAQRTRVQQQLRQLLAVWLPELNALLPELTSQWTRELLQRWPLPQQHAQIDGRTWRAFCTRHRLTQDKRAALRALATTTVLLPIDPARQAPLALQLQQLAAQLELLCGQLAVLDRRAAETWHDYPDRNLFETLPLQPGYLVHRVACALGTNRQQPLSWQQVAVAVGVAPITVASGKFRQVRRRRGCDQAAQQALTLFAFQTARAPGWARDYYTAQRHRGRPHNTALRQLARKWLRILYSLWYHRTAYDPSIPKIHTPA